MATTLAEVQETIRSSLLRDYPSTFTTQLQDLLVLGLNEEAGEVAGLRKRNLRNNSRDVGRGGREEYIEELGDVLWYLTACCSVFNTDLEEIWKYNKKKLEERYGHVDCTTIGSID